ncbi:HTTM domain-containing protein [Natronorubrum sp. JWXQ-INN-674]|uniref:HTTM domain-containing protein n=1 Tax=Natronorubrum halalkaliphilum TaxID=2691917 RepID=A0A6B0VI95_9EURY|nr:HTTM domain-containing protein [Natronorubrum halalkaliphilum]MXV60817.1 HTTM domain-containing protein [Natronorubrum halalkaliphilum]
MTPSRQHSSNGTDQRSPGLESLRAVVEPRLGIDPRALGAFRIALGLLLLFDLTVYRLPGLVTFYTDAGVFPRSALAETYPLFATWSLHALSGSAWVQGLLLALAGCAAVSLLVGYRTRLATAVSLVLLTSLYARNPHVLNGGDTILLSFLFLGLFLPLDARWSLGNPRRPDDEAGRRRCSMATVTILLHFVTIYAVNAALKFQSDIWLSGTAVRRIFRLEEYFTALGPLLAEYATLLTVANWFWIGLLTSSVFLVLFTDRLRIALVAAFVVAQVGMAATMRLGVFPFVMVAALLLFLPPRAWDRVEDLLRTIVSKTDAPLEFQLSPSLRTAATKSATPGIPAVPPRVRRIAHVASSVFLVCVLLTTVVWQVTAVGLVDSPAPELDDELSDASWAFFAPNPPDSTSWYVAEAELESGETIDAINGGDVAFDGPPDGERYPSTLWKRYGNEIRYAGDTHYEPAAAALCERLDLEHGVESLTIYHVEQPVDSDGPVGDPTSNERVSYAC